MVYRQSKRGHGRARRCRWCVAWCAGGLEVGARVIGRSGRRVPGHNPNDLQAFYTDNESVAADIDPQLSSIIGNLTKAQLPDEKLKAKLDGYTRLGNCPTLVDTRVNPEIWDKLSPPTRLPDIKLQRIQHSPVQAAVAVATGTDALVKALRSGESLPSSNMALPVTALVDGLALLINANHDLNQLRREDKRGDLNHAYKTLAASDSVAGSRCTGRICHRGSKRLTKLITFRVRSDTRRRHLLLTVSGGERCVDADTHIRTRREAGAGRYI